MAVKSSLFSLLLACVTLAAEGKWFVADEGIMGTNIHVEIWSEDDVVGEQAVVAVMQEMERINQLMSPYIADSELSLLNREAPKGPVTIGQELFDLIDLSIGISQETDGAFDITFASVGFLYQYRDQKKPSPVQIERLLDAINYRHIKLKRDNRTAFFDHPDVKIDLGGIAKGHAVERSLEHLRKMGIKHALVTAGGDTGLLGDRLGRPWMVGIRDPRNADHQAVVLPLSDTAISTSGDYERYFEQDGQRYHHILSPIDGKSAHEVQSVTITGPQSTLTDALSTAVFVLGVQRGIDLINRTPGYEALIMDNQRKLHVSDGLASSLAAEGE